MPDISKLSIKSARMALQRKEFSARELTSVSLDAIEEQDNNVHAFLEVFDDALAQADEADRKIAGGVDLPLLGIPVAIKDNMLM